MTYGIPGRQVDHGDEVFGENEDGAVAVVDLVRQLKKAVDILDVVAIMMRAEAEMNAAKHLAGEVLPSPLCVRVQATRNDLAQSVRRYEGAADAE